ncbi:2865_t:CDS:2 [Acaulospora colombiana]|uniref:2865_t:CDS:1 n=1 Tax=Acaulospora colombiana TaxID=27376 RepID=A0ACA9KPK5_9GLOM|nr:2865_t:CDS:2 [Acaulospora colombiana]
MQSTDLQDLLMCDPYFEGFTNTNTLATNDSSTAQLPSATLSEFEAQIQAMLAANNNEMTNSRANDLSFDNFIYTASPENGLFASLSSPESFIASPNSYTTLDDLTSPSPPTFNSTDFTISPSSATMTDFNHYSPMDKSIDRLLPTQSELDALFAQTENTKRHISIDHNSIDHDSVSSDNNSLKKKRKSVGGVIKSVKKTNTGMKNLIKNEPNPNTLFNESMPVVCMDGSNIGSSIGSGANSIVVPSSPADNVDASCGYTTNSVLTFNHIPWAGAPNQADGIIDGSRYPSVPSLPASCDGKNATTKLPITRLKNTNISQPQQNTPVQLNKQQKKVAHNAIERRYRNNINDRINDLKNVVPALCHLKSKDSKDDDEDDEVDGIPAATKLNKATILRKATEYIVYLKKSNEKIKGDNEILRNLLQALPGGIELLNDYIARRDKIPGDTPPDTPDAPSPDYDFPLTPPHNTNPAPRALMALFMCMTFFSSPSSVGNHASHHHSDNSRVVTNETPLDIPVIGVLGKDLYFPYLSDIHHPTIPVFKPVSTCSKIKENHNSLSSLCYTSPMNILEIVIGVITESFKLMLRKFLGWDISVGYAHADTEEKLWEVALWSRLGERIVSHFWNLAIKEKGSSGPEEKWLEIALISDQNNDTWRGVADRISDHVLGLSKNKEFIESMSNTTVPLTHISDAQALIHLKDAFSNLISVKYGKKKSQKRSRYTFFDLLGVSTPASPTHWYALVGCAVQAFSEGENKVGESLVNKLREEYPKIDNDASKRIISMGLFSYYLLMYGKVEASIRCADKVSSAVALRKKEKKSGIIDDESLDDKESETEKILKEVHHLAEFCVGWIVLEARVLGWKIIEGLSSETKENPLPDVLDVEADVFNDIPKAREGFIKRLDALGRISGGADEGAEETEEDDKVKSSCTENRAIRSWNVLKGM